MTEPLAALGPAPPFDIMPRPGIIGVVRELVDALPLAPKGNLVSNAPERELDEVLGREVGAKDPQLLACVWPFCWS